MAVNNSYWRQGPSTPGRGTLGLLGWGCAAGTLKPLAHTTEVASTVQLKQNRFDFFYSLEWQFPVSLVWTKIFSQLFSFRWKMMPSSRPKLSDLYSLSQRKLLKTIPFTAAHTYIVQYHSTLPPPPTRPKTNHQRDNSNEKRIYCKFSFKIITLIAWTKFGVNK